MARAKYQLWLPIHTVVVLEASLDWSMDDRVKIVLGVLSLASGMILRKDSK
jgi:hypothetical protein